MGCSQSTSAASAPEEGGMLRVMFNRFDKDGSGYISRENLQKMMHDDKTHFQGNDVDHILNKFGTDGKMNFEQFSLWWGSTYTTYNDDDALKRMVDEVNQEHEHMPPITEMDELAPHNSNVAVSRS